MDSADVTESTLGSTAAMVSEDVLADNLTRVTDPERFLQELNWEFGKLLLPAVVFLCVLLLLGLVGNILVLYIYTTKMKGGTTKIFILTLAALDLLGVGLGVPGEVVDMLQNFTFGDSFLCKLLRCINMFCILASGMVLCVVAIDRYKKICCPFNGQISMGTATGLVIGCCVAAMLVTSPTAILVGRRTVPIEGVAVNGSDCSTSDVYQGTAFPLGYNALQFGIFFIASVELITLYSLIGRKVWTHRQIQARRTSVFIRASSSDPATDLTPSTSPVSPLPAPSFPPARACAFGPKHPDHRKCTVFKGGNSGGRTSYNGNSTLRRRSSLRHGTARRTTQMLFLITLVFILSFLPHLALMAVKALSEDSLSGRGGWKEVLYNIAIRSYFINSVANPVIYSLCSHRFRRQGLHILTSCCKKSH